MNKGFLCIGLDPDIKRIPDRFLKDINPLWEFNKYIIDETIEYAKAYKPNIAFYEAYGSNGLEALKKTIEYVKKIDKNITVILDAKRGDIGNTASFYAVSIFEDFKADGTTLSPYMGFDSIEPFLKYKDKYIFILGLTSNPSNKDFQFIRTEDGKFLYEKVIDKVIEWNKKYYNGIGLVIGATNKEISELKNKLKGIPLLIPGIGTQKGEIDILKGILSDNVFINVARDIIYSNSPKTKAKFYFDELNRLNNLI
ncbi:MAG TPA: orotidine-5'-phosphate decarboxylase [Spirochaetota bacterium]|mgnify:CR=1 FL=1|nr:orotidine-5'-phosphate decarboxylase [Spirochaetota bacterium]HOM38291.1 orotidine-5'-phosphate decarboxylase [Spirochaetota bacterium]HPQ48491.1 orotidine-5'-phosphate decarboxylase [Spirochaetota bacterium]